MPKAPKNNSSKSSVPKSKVAMVTPIRDQIADHIRSDVISGELPPSTKLNEQSLADRFGVSRGPVRDVLLQLTKEGLLVSKSNCGVSVNTVLPPNIQDLMIDIRVKIECFAAGCIAHKLSDDDFIKLENIIDKLGRAFKSEDFTAVTKTDVEFHQYLIQLAGGDELVNLWYPIVIRMRMNYKRVSTAEDCIKEHQTILTALRSRDIETVCRSLKENIK